MESDLTTDQAQVENFSAEDQAEEMRSIVERSRQYALDQAKAADRTIRQYCEEVWGTKPCPVE